MTQKVLITGGAGYVGHVLTPRLLAAGYEVTVYDALFFGCRLPNDPKLRVVRGDIRDTAKLAALLEGQDAVLHLACISNDASFELDERLSKTINYDCFEPIVVAAKKAGVRRFVYCSSSSVYGVSNSPEVTEEHPLVPLTLYNKFKGMCEPILWKHKADNFTCVTINTCFVCPPQDLGGRPLQAFNTSTGDLFCRYQSVPNDFFCRYFLDTGLLKQDHDDGFCPPVAGIDCT